MAGEQEGAAKGGADFLTHKVGPLPLGVWMLAALGIWWYVKGRGKAGGAQTDPAGNVGTIDPKTGYVYGSSQDTSGLGGLGSGGGGGSSGTPVSSGSTTAGQYADNNAWSRAAINFLVGVGVDPTEANSAITQYVTSQTLTTEQQAEVNLAIQSIGAPPTPPTPGTSPSPIVTPPGGGTVYATNPVTGLAVTDKSANSIGVKWNKSTNAQGYTVSYATGDRPEASMQVSGTDARATLTSLVPDALYNIRVQATPAKAGAGSAQTSASTAAAPAAVSPPPAPPTVWYSGGAQPLVPGEQPLKPGEIGNSWGQTPGNPDPGYMQWDGTKWVEKHGFVPA